VARRAFGGFQMSWREFKAAGVDPFSDFSKLHFVGLPQDTIAYMVRDGVADAGTVRTNVLETMAKEKLIDLKRFRILNARTLNGNSVALSTRFYPEWPFAKMPQTSVEISEKVAIALLSLSPDHPAMKAIDYLGWTVPLDYKPVHDLFRDLEIYPYARANADLWLLLRNHWEWAVFAVTVIVLLLLHSVRTEYLVQRRTRDLTRANKELEREILERQRAEDRARQHEAELAHVSRVSVIGEMTSGLAHELRQPLAAIRNYAEGGVRRLNDRDGRDSDIRNAFARIADQAGRAGQIIEHVRSYLQNREPRRRIIDLNMAIEEAVSLVAPDAHRAD
ncbi:MAG: PhnD/SsuA/transferrin family substrate-binding protein, partial [Rhodospirillaceae bacterium]